MWSSIRSPKYEIIHSNASNRETLLDIDSVFCEETRISVEANHGGKVGKIYSLNPTFFD